MKQLLTNTTTLWTTFLMTIGMTLAFGLIMQIWQFEIIDELYKPEQISAHLAAMSAEQKLVHAWMTATLDVAYPIVYAGFFIGMALRYCGRLGPWLALPSVAVIPVDLAEGVVQVLLLNGYTDLIWLKSIITPIKLGLFLFGFAVASFGLASAATQLVRRLTKRSVN